MRHAFVSHIRGGNGTTGKKVDIGIVRAVSFAETDNGRRDLAEEIIPVVITGADLPGGLSLARGLRDLGVPIYGLALRPESPCCRSNTWAGVSPVADDSELGWLEALLKVGARHPRQVLFSAQDTVVDIISRNRDSLGEHYHFVLPDRHTVELLGDKSAFATWARTNGFPVPRTHIVSSPDELESVLIDISFPVVIKPFTRNRRWHAASGRNKAYRLDSPAALADIPFRLFDVSERYVVQEWIEGGDSDVHFCLAYSDRAGRELAHQTGRKLAQWPVGTGNTALCATTDDPALHRLTQQLFDRADLFGPASLEVKRDRRDGRYYITEPTIGRLDLQTNMATAAGVNLAAIAYHDACGRPVDAESTRARRSAIWVSEADLPRALVVAALHRQLNLVELVRALFRSRAVMFAYGAIGDMRPLGALLADKARAVARMVTGQMSAHARRGQR